MLKKFAGSWLVGNHPADHFCNYVSQLISSMCRTHARNHKVLFIFFCGPIGSSLVNSRGPTKKIFFMSPTPGSWILVPRSWYQDLGNKILVPRSTESPRGGASRFAGGHGGLQAPRQGVWGAGSPPGRAGGLGGSSPPVKTI